MRIFERSPGLIEQEIEGETVILDKAAGLIHQLNPTASEIWRACDGKRNLEDIAALIAERYDIDFQKSRADVVDALTQLEEQQL
ncbi:MAG: PqqD family protein, partial [Thioalkalispiraceae bacterium]